MLLQILILASFCAALNAKQIWWDDSESSTEHWLSFPVKKEKFKNSEKNKGPSSSEQ